MIRNFVKVGFRNLLRNKGVSLINISGLSVGVACTLLIMAYVIDEVNYDDFYDDGESLYRLQLHRTFPGRESWFATTPIPIGRTLEESLPEIEEATRLFRVFNELQVSRNRIDNFYETRVLAADSNFFRLFSIPFVAGNPDKALETPNSVVLTSSTAEKYFGSTNVIGQSLELQDSMIYNVTAVIEDIPKRSHFEFDLLLSLSSFPQISNNNFWGSYICYNYVKLKPGVQPDEVIDKVPGIVEQFMAPQVEAIVGSTYEDYVAAGNHHNYFLLPVRDIHLSSNYQNEIKPNGSMINVYFFSVIATLILAIACFNFMNLSTASSVKRAKEVGMRKVLGSEKHMLRLQFIVESMVVTFVSTLVALSIFIYTLPFFNDLAAKNISPLDFDGMSVSAVLLVLILVVGLFAGIYPAFFITSFSTIKILKGGLKLKNKKLSLRNVLVTAQFAVSIFLVLATMLIFRQTHHMISQRLGFDKEKILVIDRANSISNPEQFISQLKSNASITSASSSFHIPGRNIGGGTFEAIGVPATERYLFDAMTVDYNYSETYGLELLAGRFFDHDLQSDTAAVVVNQATVDMVGWDDPIGKEILPTSGNRMKIIGVVNDFHYASLHEKISPLVFFGIPRQSLINNPPPQLSIRMEGTNPVETVSFVTDVWKQWNPDEEMAFNFLDAEFDALYETEQNFAAIFSTFTFLAIFIAIVGVLGLSAFISAQRIKEIGVRRVLGATTGQLLMLLSADFVRLVLVANLITAPVAYFLMDIWLEDYPYSTGIPYDLMILTFVGSLLIIVATVSFHGYRVARTNPAKTLKYE